MYIPWWAIVIAFLMLLWGIGDAHTDISALEKRVNELEEQVEELRTDAEEEEPELD